MAKSRLVGHWALISIFILVQSLILLLLPSCAKRRSPQEWVRPEVQVKADTTLVCKDPAEPGCAVPTPFAELWHEIYGTSKILKPH